MVICQGGNMAGRSLHVKDNKPVYFYNWIGVDAGAPVGPYPHEFHFTGKIRNVEVEVGPVLEALPQEQRDKLMGESMAHAALTSQ